MRRARAFLGRLGPAGWAGLAILAVIALAAVVGPVLSPYGVHEQDLAARNDREILVADAKNVTAMAGLARNNLQTGDVEQAKELLGPVEAKDKTNAGVVAGRASSDLGGGAGDAGLGGVGAGVTHKWGGLVNTPHPPPAPPTTRRQDPRGTPARGGG